LNTKTRKRKERDTGRIIERLPARRVPRRLKAIHFIQPCSKYSSMTSGKSPCNGSSTWCTPQGQTMKHKRQRKNKEVTWRKKKKKDNENRGSRTNDGGVHHREAEGVVKEYRERSKIESEK